MRSIVNNVKTFTDARKFVNCLSKIKKSKILMVISGSPVQNIVARIHHLPQIYSIFIFYRRNKAKYEQLAKNWFKIKGVQTDFGMICELMKIAVKNIEKDSVDTSITLNSNAADQNMDFLDQSYMYTLLLKECLIAMKHDERSIEEFVDYCCDSHGNELQEREIEQFHQEYHQHSPIW
ncbi:unnamed protein product, partial [Rotaria sp. Silwood2]